MHAGDKYSFLNAPLRNVLNAIFSQAVLCYCGFVTVPSSSFLLGGLRRSFASLWSETGNPRGLGACHSLLVIMWLIQ